MTDCDTTSRARKLGDAIEAYLEQRANGRDPDAAWVDEHPALREWLAPLLDAGPDELPSLGDPRLTLLGDFRLVRERGRGGMGVVFEAIQLSLGRRVALKVLAADRTSSATSIERFRREATAAAKLQHPSIVQVHGVGEIDGRHVIAMEYVDGPNLAERIEQQRGVPFEQRRLCGEHDSRSHVVQVADLTAKLADALALAHRNGIVHRDVKPHNVLLQSDGTPKLVDFGIAKDFDAASLSQTRELIGTSWYMSPEQSTRGGSVDARSDVFSLGVVLYELLAFARPFDGDTQDEVLTSIRETEPKPLRTRDARIPLELELICGRAIEKSPGDRYASAADLAADLRRFLRHEPISVRPPGLVRRLRRIARRHRLALVATVAAVGTLGGLLAMASEWRRVGVDAQRVQTRRAEQFAFSAVDELLAVLAAQLPRTALSDTAGRERLRAAVALYEAYLADVGAEHELRAPVARASAHVGALLAELGLLGEANAAYTRSIELWRSVVAERPNDARVADALADAYRARMTVAQRRFDVDAACADFATDVEIRRAAIAAAPDDVAARAALARTLLARGRGLASELASSADARSVLEQAVAVFTQIAGATAHDADLRLGALQARTALAFLDQESGRLDEALAAFTESLAVAEAGVEAGLGPEWRGQVAECEYGLGATHRRLKQNDRAEHHLRRALAEHDALRTETPGRPDVLHRNVGTRGMLGTLLIDRGDLDAAEKELAVARADAALLLQAGVDTARAALLFASLSNRWTAVMLRRDPKPSPAVLKAYAEAASALERARPEFAQVAAIRSSLGATLANEAAARFLNGEIEIARGLIDRAVESQTAALRSDPTRTTWTTFLRNHHVLRAQILLTANDPDGAAAAVEDSIRVTPDARLLGPAIRLMRQAAQATTDPTLAATRSTRADELQERRTNAPRKP